MPNNFCGYLSNGYSFTLKSNSLLTVKPCCWFQKEIPVDSNLSANRKNVFESITNWTPACKKCQTLEKSGQKSLRQTSVDWIDSDEDCQDPVAIDIHLDNRCNAACVTCGAYASSLWEKEQAKLRHQKIQILAPSSTDAVNKILSSVSLSKLKYVKFFGGEPLFTDTHLQFIRHIPRPEHVTLQYTTNGSIYPSDETLAAWKKFKTIIFAASLDGINEQFDYVRWPLPWSKVSRNLIRLKQNRDIWNLLFRIEFTANFLNTYYFDRLETWVKENIETNAFGDPTEINIHPCWATWELAKMPTGIREKILEKYPQTHVIHRLVANLPQKMLPMSDWQKFVETWDCRRHNSWQQAFPDLVQYI